MGNTKKNPKHIIPPRYAAAGSVGLVVDALHTFVEKTLASSEENHERGMDAATVIYFLRVSVYLCAVK